MNLFILEDCKLLKNLLKLYLTLISIKCEYKIGNLNVHKWDCNSRCEKLGIFRRNATTLIIHTAFSLFKFICFITNGKEWSCGNQGDEVWMAQKGRKNNSKRYHTSKWNNFSNDISCNENVLLEKNLVI